MLSFVFDWRLGLNRTHRYYHMCRNINFYIHLINNRLVRVNSYRSLASFSLLHQVIFVHLQNLSKIAMQNEMHIHKYKILVLYIYSGLSILGRILRYVSSDQAAIVYLRPPRL